MTRNHPHFRDLSDEEARALLTHVNVGRLAFTLHDRVDIEPINYASDGEWVFGRTGVGTKLTTLLHNPWCAFEADEVRDLFDWSSVVVKGTFYLLDPEIDASGTYDRAVALLRDVVPETFTQGDPVPQRGIVFGIFVHELTGREARP
jgi:nitroimidazol reductase NimA-like FMN-containing flavoprotein (pyridoxamine 5'-phosphate oxidase superfamily)